MYHSKQRRTHKVANQLGAPPGAGDALQQLTAALEENARRQLKRKYKQIRMCIINKQIQSQIAIQDETTKINYKQERAEAARLRRARGRRDAGRAAEGGGGRAAREPTAERALALAGANQILQYNIISYHIISYMCIYIYICIMYVYV